MELLGTCEKHWPVVMGADNRCDEAQEYSVFLFETTLPEHNHSEQ
jgi:hypothetical protein